MRLRRNVRSVVKDKKEINELKHGITTFLVAASVLSDVSPNRYLLLSEVEIESRKSFVHQSNGIIIG